MRELKIQKNDNVTLCVIEVFSNDLKNLIRENLTSICHGVGKVSRKPELYTYKRTLEEFLNRFESKKYEHRIGMIGELLFHVLVLQLFPNFHSVNPFFNMEERNVKKGFDLVLVDSDNRIWITEVKSGQLGRVETSSKKNHSLLGTAKRDLIKRLNLSDEQIWHNAINGAMVAIKNGNIKNQIIDILETSLDEAFNTSSKSDNKNVILTSVLFEKINNPIEFNRLDYFYEKNTNETDFHNVLVVLIQKSTIDKVVEFLKIEVCNE